MDQNQSILTKETLLELGIELDEQSYELLAEHFDTTLQDRVIDEIVAELTPEQARELATLKGQSGDQAYAWLRANVPEFADIVTDEVDILLGEVAQDSDKIAA